MIKKSFEFSNLFSSEALNFEDRKEKFERSNKMKFDEEFHIKNRLEWTVDLYYELDQYILGLNKGIRKEYLQSYIKFSFRGLLFCYIATRKVENLRVWTKVAYSKLGDKVPLFVRDYEPVSRRLGVLISFDNKREFLESREAMLETTFGIIKKAFQGVESRKGRKKTPLEAIKKRELERVKPIEEFRSSLNLLVNSNGYIEVNFKIKKDQRELLNRILQETILK